MQSTDVLQPSAAGNENHSISTTVPNYLDVATLTREHGSALCSLAAIILVDRVEAEEAVKQLLAHACSAAFTTRDGGSRRLLSRRLYLTCTWARLVSGPPQQSPTGQEEETDVREDAMARLIALSEQQRAAIALFIYGDHNPQEVAELISLPAPVVLNLLRSGLDELCLADTLPRRHAADEERCP